LPRQMDLEAIRKKAVKNKKIILDRLSRFENASLGLWDRRWCVCMSLVEFHGIWERFAEKRLVASLNKYPQHFLERNIVRGIKTIPVGLAEYLVRGGRKYFDFQSCGDLIKKANHLVAGDHNPFAKIKKDHQAYLDTMSAIRNFLVHNSDAARLSYKDKLNKVFGITSAPEPIEFLDSKDRRQTSPLKGQSRILVIAYVMDEVIKSI
jgi:hypothetical protein